MDKEKKSGTSRREALKKLFKGAGVMGMAGIPWAAYVSELKSSDLVLRPPGALAEQDFLKACVKCGTCVEACPYDTLKLANGGDGIALGTPYFTARETPCYMCPDVPCVPVCPSGALDMERCGKMDDQGVIKPDINKATMGLAVIHKESCIAFWGIQCDACYRACPLMDEAITLDYERNERTGKHAFLKPVVQSEVCTGCGMCEHACVTEKAAIKVLPRSVAMGKVGNHYIKGWDKDDEQRLHQERGRDGLKESGIPAEDYLNNWEDLLDDD